MVPTEAMSPPASPTLSPTTKGISKSSNGQGTPLHIDLSSLPPLTSPSPPSNTLLITNLNSPATFHPQSLENIRQLLSTPTPLNSFSPLRSFRRIIVSYPTIDAAIATRQLLDGTSTKSIAPPADTSEPDAPPDGLMNTGREDRIRIYFGEPTPVAGLDEEVDHHLKAPSLGKLLFISPPPSPPCGWEIREEDPPNKDTHAEDLQRALAGLNTAGASLADTAAGANEGQTVDDVTVEVDAFGKATTEGSRKIDMLARRGRSASMTMVYHPKDHGDREDLPAVMVEDTTGEHGEMEEESLGVPLGDGFGDDVGSQGKTIMAHTARPPVDLMEE